MIGSAHGDAAPLLGRLEERSLLTSLLDDVATRGHALVFRGEPGIGKSRLLSVCERLGRERGMAALSTIGVQSEAHLPFAGLHQLLRPVRDRLAFVARRIESDPIVLLVAIREGYPSALGEVGLPEHTVAALDDTTAAALLDGPLRAFRRRRVPVSCAKRPGTRLRSSSCRP